MAPKARKAINRDELAITKGIGRYLDELETTSVVGNKGVSLGAIGNGLPAWTTNPDDVERAIKVVREQAQHGTAVQRLTKQQRIHTLMHALEELRASGDADTNREVFIAHALEWATKRGIGYGAFRAMGVPVSVLKQAGITRGFEP